MYGFPWEGGIGEISWGNWGRRWANGNTRKRVGWAVQGRQVGGWMERENNLIGFIICWGQVEEKPGARKPSRNPQDGSN